MILISCMQTSCLYCIDYSNHLQITVTSYLTVKTNFIVGSFITIIIYYKQKYNKYNYSYQYFQKMVTVNF